MVRFATILAPIVFLAVTVPRSAGADLADTVERFAPGVVGVRAEGAPRRGPGTTRSGSGMVFDRAGHILTSRALVDGARTVRVIVDADHEVEARVVGTDDEIGIALLVAILPANALPLPRGRPETLRVGAGTVVISRTPRGGIAVRPGVLSRRDPGLVLSDSYLETFPAFGPAEEGAPLLSPSGEVLGVCTTVAGPAGGVAAAVPIDLAAGSAGQLVDTGRVAHGFLGLQLRRMTDEEAHAASVGGPARVQVTVAVPASAGAAAGLQAGDVILAIDGRAAREPLDVVRLVFGHRPGERVRVAFSRGGTRREIDVTLGPRPPAP